MKAPGKAISIIFDMLILLNIFHHYSLITTSTSIKFINIHTLLTCLLLPSKAQRTRISTTNFKLYSNLTSTQCQYNLSSLASHSIPTAPENYKYKGRQSIITTVKTNSPHRPHNIPMNKHSSLPRFFPTVTQTPQTPARYIIISASKPYRSRQQSATYLLQAKQLFSFCVWNMGSPLWNLPQVMYMDCCRYKKNLTKPGFYTLTHCLNRMKSLNVNHSQTFFDSNGHCTNIQTNHVQTADAPIHIHVYSHNLSIISIYIQHQAAEIGTIVPDRYYRRGG